MKRCALLLGAMFMCTANAVALEDHTQPAGAKPTEALLTKKIHAEKKAITNTIAQTQKLKHRIAKLEGDTPSAGRRNEYIIFATIGVVLIALIAVGVCLWCRREPEQEEASAEERTGTLAIAYAAVKKDAKASASLAGDAEEAQRLLKGSNSHESLDSKYAPPSGFDRESRRLARGEGHAPQRNDILPGVVTEARMRPAEGQGVSEVVLEPAYVGSSGVRDGAGVQQRGRQRADAARQSSEKKPPTSRQPGGSTSRRQSQEGPDLEAGSQLSGEKGKKSHTQSLRVVTAPGAVNIVPATRPSRMIHAGMRSEDGLSEEGSGSGSGRGSVAGAIPASPSKRPSRAINAKQYTSSPARRGSPRPSRTATQRSFATEPNEADEPRSQQADKSVDLRRISRAADTVIQKIDEFQSAFHLPTEEQPAEKAARRRE